MPKIVHEKHKHNKHVRIVRKELTPEEHVERLKRKQRMDIWRKLRKKKHHTLVDLVQRVEILEEILKEHGWLEDE